MSDYFLRTLFVHTPGTRLILEGDAVKALRDGVDPRRLPLRSIDTVVVCSGIDVSTPLLLRCAEDGRMVTFVSRFGKPRAVVTGPLGGRGRLRRAQYSSHLDAERRRQLATTVVAGKIDQMSWALRQWARDADSSVAARLRDTAMEVIAQRDSVHDATSREMALGIEGAATKKYFGGLGLAMRGHDWTGRTRRPPKDPVNASLSFLYGICRTSVHGAIHVAGLDPYCGFLHGDMDGQPSLVLDLLEEFRPSVDRVVLTLLNTNRLRTEHFEYDALGACSLNADGRDAVMSAWHTHRVSKVRISGAAAAVPHAALPLVQANAMANALRYDVSYGPHRLVVS